MAIMKKGMGKPMKKAQNGTVAKKKPAKTYPIISEEGDLADALNETARMRAAGKAPKTSAGGMKVMDKFQKQGKLGPAKPKMKMGGTMKKAQDGTSFAKLAPPYDKATYADKIAGATKGKAKMGKSIKKAQMGATMTAAPIMKKGGSMKKCKYGCK
jgi:hypothetical protein